MGLFGKKKEQSEEKIYEKNEESVLKESLETEVEGLQIEFRTKQEEIDNITKRLQSVKEEYDEATGNLMALKRESNQKKLELDTIYLEYKSIKSKISESEEKFNKNKKINEEVDRAEINLTKKNQELEKITKEYDEIKEKITEGQSKLHEINAQQIQAQKELEEITSRLYNAKHEVKNPRQDTDNETGVFTSKEKEFIEGEITDKKASKGIIEAASAVVGGLKSKLSKAEKELETLHILLDKERRDHAQTRDELEKLKEKSESKE